VLGVGYWGVGQGGRARAKGYTLHRSYQLSTYGFNCDMERKLEAVREGSEFLREHNILNNLLVRYDMVVQCFE
jgi:hypothetical protein